MMKLLILPGFSLKNKVWAEQMVDKFQPQFEGSIYEWEHWTSGDSAEFSIERETQTVIRKIQEWGEIPLYVLAKSIGTFVFANILKKEKIPLQKVILCGIPLNDLKENEWDVYSSLRTLKVGHSICFQNDSDPHANFAQVSKFFNDKNIQIPVIEKRADNHDYSYFSDFHAFLNKK